MAGSIAAIRGGPATGDFGATLQRALQGAVDDFHAADSKAMEAITGGGNLTEVVTALSRARTDAANRDRDPRPRGAGLPGHHEDADLSG